MRVRPIIDWKEEFRARLVEQKKAAVQAHAEWSRRWFLSLALGNGAGIGGVGAALLNGRATQDATLLMLLPSIWAFAVGLIAGALIPFCWAKSVEHVGQWAHVKEAELDADGPTSIYDADDDGELSSEVLRDLEKHQDGWLWWRSTCQKIAVIAFLIGLFWPLVFITAAAVWKFGQESGVTA